MGVTANATNDIQGDDRWFSDHSGAIGFKVTSSKCKDKRIRYEIRSNEDYFTPISGQVYLTSRSQEIFPDIPWKYSEISCIKERESGTIFFKFYDDEGNSFETTETVYYRSPNDCIWKVNLSEEGYSKDKFVDMSWMFSAYVNEESSYISGIGNEIIKANTFIKSWGYAGGNHALQLNAIWEYFLSKNFRYISVTTTIDGTNRPLIVQKVRDIKSSLEDEGANCIDGTVLLASLLRHWGYPCYIVIVPGHAFIAMKAKLEGKAYLIHVETTLLSSDKNFIEAIKKGEEVLHAYQAEYGDQSIEYRDINRDRSFVKPIQFRECK